MKKQNIISVALTVVIASAVIIGSAYALKTFNLKKSLSPEETVNAFLSEWIEYDGNPMVDRIYRENEKLTEEYVLKVDNILDTFDKSGFDPILCAQDIPEEIIISNTAVKEDKATVSLEQIFSGSSRPIIVNLEKEAGIWKISDIICQEGEGGNDLNAGVSPVIQNTVGDYIRENINELSPEKAVLGGTFYVTSIRFIDSYNCIVEYEDGHIALEARVEFSVPAEGEVVIESFTIDDEFGTADFKKTGNLTKSGENWNLVYEEPGKPALSVDLEFNEKSLCTDAYKNNSCSPVYWEIGDRAEIIGYREENRVLVTYLRIIGESSKQISGGGSISNFQECVSAGNEVFYPDCIGCKPYCETSDGQRFEEQEK
jgi:hypothetical protein